jgi:hypothetical protein
VDPTSFLRLAHIEAASPDGTKFSLLRIEVEAATDVGSITPHLGGTSFRYDPRPASMIRAASACGLSILTGMGRVRWI